MSDAAMPGSWEVGDEWDNLAELAAIECDMYLRFYTPLLRGLRQHRRRVRVKGFGDETTTRSRGTHIWWARGETIQPWRAVLRETVLTLPTRGDTTWHSVQQSMDVMTHADKRPNIMTLRRPRLIVSQEGRHIVSAELDRADQEALLATPQDVVLDGQRAWLDRLHAIATAADRYDPSLEAGRNLVLPVDDVDV
jgi:hypothetical protein